MDNNHNSIHTVGYPFNLIEQDNIMSHHNHPAPYRDCYCDGTGSEDVEYCEFLYQVDKAVKSMVGMSRRDLPDLVDVAAQYHLGQTPKQVARNIVRTAAQEFDSIPADMIEDIFDI